MYGLVVPSVEVEFPGVLVGHFTGGEPLRAVLPKDVKGRGQRYVQEKVSILLSQSSDEGDVGHGICLKLVINYKWYHIRAPFNVWYNQGAV